MNRVSILVTGGTFDKEYNELDGSLFFRRTHVPEMLKLGRCQVPTTIGTIMMKDSLDMRDKDRQQILERVSRSRSKNVVVTHGTDTMDGTARLLGRAGLDKTIILTGAMVPYTFGSSDGLFNLGSALAYSQILPPGVYVVMNGRCFHWWNVKKDRTAGVFIESKR